MTQQEMTIEVEVLNALMTNQKALTMGEIVQQTGNNGDNVRRAINRLRLKGFPICSNQFGYELTTDKSKIRATIDSMNRRILNQLKTKMALEQHLKETKHESI